MLTLWAVSSVVQGKGKPYIDTLNDHESILNMLYRKEILS